MKYMTDGGADMNYFIIRDKLTGEYVCDVDEQMGVCWSEDKGERVVFVNDHKTVKFHIASLGCIGIIGMDILRLMRMVMKLSDCLLQESNLEKPISGTITNKELVFDLFINGGYKRTFVNDVQINEFCKRVWNKDELASVEIRPVYRYYLEVK